MSASAVAALPQAASVQSKLWKRPNLQNAAVRIQPSVAPGSLCASFYQPIQNMTRVFAMSQACARICSWKKVRLLPGEELPSLSTQGPKSEDAPGLVQEAAASVRRLDQQLGAWRLQALLGGPYDAGGAVVSIQVGTHKSHPSLP